MWLKAVVIVKLINKSRWPIAEIKLKFNHKMSNISRPVGIIINFVSDINCHICVVH